MTDSSVETDLKKLSEDMRVLRSDFTRLIETVGATVKSRGEHVADDLRMKAENLTEKADLLGRDAAHSIKQNPFAAIMIAFGIGTLLGLFSGQCRR